MKTLICFLFMVGIAHAKNVVLINGDDMRVDDVQFVSSLSELAARGKTYERAFASFSLCTPSRTSMLTATLPSRTGVYTNDPRPFNASSTMAVWFQSAGYHTAMIGKYLNRMELLNGVVPPGWDTWRAYGKQNELGVNQAHVLDVMVREFIATAPRPFFLYLAPTMPHGPLRGPRECRDDAPPLPTPPSFDEAVREQAEKQWSHRVSSLCGLDIVVRAVIEALGEEESTIIFTADQGFHLGEHGEIGKLTVYEEVVRIPLIIVDPSLGPGVSDQLVSIMDIGPTIADLIGAAIPEDLDGRSIFGPRRMYAPIQDQTCIGVRRKNSKHVECSGVVYDWNINDDPWELDVQIPYN